LFAMARRLPARRPTLAPRAYRGGNGRLGARSQEIERQPSAHDGPSAVLSGAPRPVARLERVAKPLATRL